MQVEAPNRGADEGDGRRARAFAAFDAMLVMTKSSVPVLIAMLVVEGLALYAAWYLQAGCLQAAVQQGPAARVSGVRSFEAVR